MVQTEQSKGLINSQVLQNSLNMSLNMSLNLIPLMPLNTNKKALQEQ